MTPLRERMLQDMRLAGLSARTSEAYSRAVRQLAEHYGRSPDKITGEEVRAFFIHGIEERRWSPPTVTIALCGITFFYKTTLQRPLPALEFIRPAREKKRPTVLSRDEVIRVLGAVRVDAYRACLTTIYACA